MRSNKFLFIIIIFLGAIGLLLILSKDKNPASWETKTDNQGAVTVTVTPVNLGADATAWPFNIILETHSVELDYDLTKIATLRDNNGREYQPLGWEGDPPGGHHRQGQLLFAPIAPGPTAIELAIRNIDNITRLFKWNL